MAQEPGSRTGTIDEMVDELYAMCINSHSWHVSFCLFLDPIQYSTGNELVFLNETLIGSNKQSPPVCIGKAAYFLTVIRMNAIQNLWLLRLRAFLPSLGFETPRMGFSRHTRRLAGKGLDRLSQSLLNYSIQDQNFNS